MIAALIAFNWTREWLWMARRGPVACHQSGLALAHCVRTNRVVREVRMLRVLTEPRLDFAMHGGLGDWILGAIGSESVARDKLDLRS